MKTLKFIFAFLFLSSLAFGGSGSYFPPPSAGGGGDVIGPLVGTDNAIARFNGDGQHLKNSSVFVSDTNNIDGLVDLNMTGNITSAGAFTFGNNAVEDPSYPYYFDNIFVPVTGTAYSYLSFFSGIEPTAAYNNPASDFITFFDFETNTDGNNQDLGILNNFYNYINVSGSGTLDELIGVQYGSLVNGTRVVDDNYGLLLQTGHFGTAGGSLADDKTITIQTPAFGNGATMASHIGLYLQNQQVGSNPATGTWAIKSDGGRVHFDFTVPAFDGSDNYDAFVLEPSQGNHTGADNTVQVLTIGDINFDAQADTYALKIGTGYKYSISMPNNGGLLIGTDGGNRADITFGGTDLSIFTTGAVQVSSVLQGTDGTATAPAFTFINDTDANTGVFRAAEDIIGFASEGEQIFNMEYVGGQGAVLRFRDGGFRINDISGIEYITFNGFSTPWTFGSNVGSVVFNQEVTNASTGSMGWSVVAGANTACTTTCTNAAVFGFDGTTPVGPADATADVCVCAGAN